MAYWSRAWSVEVRDEIAKEFTRPDGRVDDMLAGLHEVRARLQEQRDRKAAAGTAARPAPP